MADEAVSDVKTVPEPSTGTTLTPPSEPEAYSEWRLTGKVPVQAQAEKQTKPKQETSAPSPSAEGESDGASTTPDEPEETAPAPEAGKKKQEFRKGSAADRLNELISDLRRAGLTPSELKTFRKEVQAQPAQPPAQTSVTPPPPKKLTEPKLEEFKTWEEFRAAERAFNAQQVDERIQAAVTEFQRQHAQAEVNRQAAERLRKARERYGEEAEGFIRSAASSVFGDQTIHPALKEIVNDSPVIEDLLYVMGSDPVKLERFVQTARTNLREAVREVVTLEQTIKDQLKPASNGTSPANGTTDHTTPERDESGRFLPAKKEAPPPAREVSGRASLPPNEADAAFHRGDVRAYFDRKNREQIAQRKGR